MAVVRAEAKVVGETGRSLGSGIAYRHLPRGSGQEQEATGTVSLRSWNAGVDAPRALRLVGWGELAIDVSRDALSECSRNRILRFRARWVPLREPGTDP